MVKEERVNTTPKRNEDEQAGHFQGWQAAWPPNSWLCQFVQL